MQQLRAATLAMCNAPASEYEVVFTSGASAALNMIAECFPWSSDSRFAYTMENHTSVLGMRGPALAAGANACAVEASASKGLCSMTVWVNSMSVWVKKNLEFIVSFEAAL